MIVLVRLGPLPLQLGQIADGAGLFGEGEGSPRRDDSPDAGRSPPELK